LKLIVHKVRNIRRIQGKIQRDITQKSVWPPIKFSEDIILQKLNKLNTSKSDGPDELHPKILYEVKNEISLPLSLLFETSFRPKQLPQDWTTADIATIHKKRK